MTGKTSFLIFGGFLPVECKLQTKCGILPQYPVYHLSSYMERSTPQREAIRALFTKDGDPLTPQEILDRASDQAPKLSLATVYRTIRVLEEVGEVVAVEFPGESARYELAGKGHHHHFCCEHCHRAFDVKHCPGDLSQMTPEGFKLHRHEITLYGLCPDCV
jgi:Fur family transcriptional regulator, ferric uptake regulator